MMNLNATNLPSDKNNLQNLRQVTYKDRLCFKEPNCATLKLEKIPAGYALSVCVGRLVWLILNFSKRCDLNNCL